MVVLSYLPFDEVLQTALIAKGQPDLLAKKLYYTHKDRFGSINLENLNSRNIRNTKTLGIFNRVKITVTDDSQHNLLEQILRKIKDLHAKNKELYQDQIELTLQLSRIDLYNFFRRDKGVLESINTAEVWSNITPTKSQHEEETKELDNGKSLCSPVLSLIHS